MGPGASSAQALRASLRCSCQAGSAQTRLRLKHARFFFRLSLRSSAAHRRPRTHAPHPPHTTRFARADLSPTSLIPARNSDVISPESLRRALRREAFTRCVRDARVGAVGGGPRRAAREGAADHREEPAAPTRAARLVGARAVNHRKNVPLSPPQRAAGDPAHPPTPACQAAAQSRSYAHLAHRNHATPQRAHAQHPVRLAASHDANNQRQAA